MADLKFRLGDADLFDAPDLWIAIQGRVGSRPPIGAAQDPRPDRRGLRTILAVAATLAVTIAIVVLVSRALRPPVHAPLNTPLPSLPQPSVAQPQTVNGPGPQPPGLFSSVHGMIVYLRSSPSGRTAEQRLVAVDPATGAQTVLIPHLEVAPVAWAPSGDALLFSNGDFVNADGSVTHLLAPGHDIQGSFSPDGTRVAYSTEQAELYVIDASGQGSRRLLASGAYGASWSPDGTRIAFVTQTGGRGWAIETIRPDGTDQRVVFRTALRDTVTTEPVSWSPDGSQIAFTWGLPCCDASAYGIGVVDADGTNFQMLRGDDGSSDPVWSPDGSQIVFVLRHKLYKTKGPYGVGGRPLAAGVDTMATWNPGS